jgi:plastocyanin
MGDNFFELDGERNPTISVPAGDTLSIDLTNEGLAIHNMRISGEDTTYNTSDDAVSDPTLVSGGGTATIEWTAPDSPGEIDYQCDFHPTDMKGVISVE